MSQSKPLTSRQENWAFAKALLVASPFVVWLSWVMAVVSPKLATAGGMIVVMSWASAFTAGLLACGVIAREWQRWLRNVVAVACITLALLLGYLAMTVTWLRYPVN